MKSSALIYIFIDDLGRTISFFFFWSLEIYTKIVCAILHDLHWGGGIQEIALRTDQNKIKSCTV